MTDTTKYEDIYPSEPVIRSSDIVHPRAADVLRLEYFEAEPDTMPTLIFDEHHILINLHDKPLRVENWRDGEHRDFIYHKNEIVVTPAGVESGWRWHEKSKCIVVTITPDALDHFSKRELGLLLTQEQLCNQPQFEDADLTSAAVMLLGALQERRPGYEVMYESLARVFLVKLLQSYGLERETNKEFGASFTAEHYKKVLDFVESHYAKSITVEDIAAEAGMSTAHFSRLFKETIGETPYQFLMAFRVERAQEKLADLSRPMIDIALACGFADQPHFSRTFTKATGMSPKAYRKSL
jgi:AraC family transcriptional regulator